ncbi:hypothetical protein O181_043165 [Austropuccinia psidii MF-1]|uniref:Uncharacterized protein n=1 Tax=Austropuccinia psidii MF-1 TaxID=1389203 RepID=A0A9Q3DM08_9BASI|nr:hypothetical protein [Austropuccinia psidii MF-1]
MQTPRQPTPGPRGTQWSDDLFCGKQKAITFLILTFDSNELTLPPFVEPSQHNEPPSLGPSQCSEPQVPSHEDALTREPEPEEAPMQSMEEPFGKSPLQPFLTPPLTISSLSLSQPWRQAGHYHSLLMENFPTPSQQAVSWKIHQIQFQTSIQLNTGKTQI